MNSIKHPLFVWTPQEEINTPSTEKSKMAQAVLDQFKKRIGSWRIYFHELEADNKLLMKVIVKSDNYLDMILGRCEAASTYGAYHLRHIDITKLHYTRGS